MPSSYRPPVPCKRPMVCYGGPHYRPMVFKEFVMFQVPDQGGRLAVVTGANSGTGKEAAEALAGAGASVILAVRTLAKGEQAREEMLAAHPSADIQVRRLDLADLSSVEQ